MVSVEYLKDRVAIVTGAARGIGNAIAVSLCRAGAKVALVDLREEGMGATVEELTNAGGIAASIVTDVTCPEQVETMTGRVESELGPPDILINNAGTFSYIGPLWEAEPEVWFHDTRVNLFGVFLCCRAIVGRMVARGGGGYVINIASSGGVSDAHPYGANYACPKVAQVRLTEGLAREAGRFGVKVFAIGPPAIPTEMTRFIATDPGGRKWRPGFGKLLAPETAHSPRIVTDLIMKLLSGRADKLSGRFFPATCDFESIVEQTEEILDRDLLVLRLRDVETSAPKRRERRPR